MTPYDTSTHFYYEEIPMPGEQPSDIAPVGDGIKTLDRLPPHDELQAHLAEAAGILARLGDDDRTGSVCYLLEEIEAQRTAGGNPQLKKGFEEWLRDVQAELRLRLRRGGW